MTTDPVAPLGESKRDPDEESINARWRGRLAYRELCAANDAKRAKLNHPTTVAERGTWIDREGREHSIYDDGWQR